MRPHGDEAHVGQHLICCGFEERGLTNWRDYFLEPTGNKVKDPKQRTWDLLTTILRTRGSPNVRLPARKNTPKMRALLTWANISISPTLPSVPEPYASMYDPAEIVIPGLEAGIGFDQLPEHLARTKTSYNSDWSDIIAKPMEIMRMAPAHVFDPDANAENIATYYGMISFLDDQIDL